MIMILLDPQSRLSHWDRYCITTSTAITITTTDKGITITSDTTTSIDIDTEKIMVDITVQSATTWAIEDGVIKSISAIAVATVTPPAGINTAAMERMTRNVTVSSTTEPPK